MILGRGIIAYDLWYFAITYTWHLRPLGLTRRPRAACWRALSPRFFIQEGAWFLQASRAVRWQHVDHVRDVTVHAVFADVLAPIPTTHNPTAFFAVSFLALASNVALAAYQFRKIRKLKLNPLKDELYADTKSYQELEEANR